MAAQQAAQQAQLNAQIAAQYAQQAMQQAAQQAQMNAQIAAQQASQPISLPECCSPPLKPKFSVKAGTYMSPVSVRITDSTRGAIIYYTTDGWSPTPASNRYVGPITIDSTTTLQAIAVAPYYSHTVRSFVVSADYVIKTPAGAATAPAANTTPAGEAAPAVSAGGKVTLLKDTQVPLVFAGDATSKTAQVGDRIPMTLMEDLKVGDVVVAPKGTATTALVIQVDKTSAGGGPGDLTFEVDYLPADGSVIKLRGVASREGDAKPPNAAIFIPVVGPLTIFKHGKDAEIKAGMTFTAYVDDDFSVAAK
jgi:hypothetical protein